MTHREGAALGAGGALAHGLLPALVARLPIHLIVHPVARRVVAVHKELPVGGTGRNRRQVELFCN